jgi:O-antigen ligase/polysaccharide polymerase Wzy-like membrane protein
MESQIATTTLMQKIRWIAVAVLFLALGFGASVARNNLSQAALFLLLVAPLFLVTAPVGLAQGLRRVPQFMKSLCWYHWLWLLMVASTLVFRIRASTAIQQSPLDGWAAYRIALVSTAAIILMMVYRRVDWIGSMRRGLLGALSAYAIICLVSAIWSAYPAWTIYKSAEYLVDVAVLAAVVASMHSAQDYKRFLDWLWLIVVLQVCSVWLGTLLWPESAFIRGSALLGQRICGVSPAIDQDTVGEYGAILAIVGFARLQLSQLNHRMRAFYLTLACVGFVTLMRSQARVAFVGFMLAAALILYFRKRWKATLLIACATLLLIVFTNVSDVAWAVVQRGDQQQGLETMSGRLPRWRLGWEAFVDQPLIGYGAYAGQRFVIGPKLHDSTLAELLNTYLDVLVGTGVIGLIPVVIVVFGGTLLLWRAARSPALAMFDRQLAVEILAVLAIELCRSFFADRLITHTGFLMAGLFGYAEFLRRRDGRQRVLKLARVRAMRVPQAFQSGNPAL